MGISQGSDGTPNGMSEEDWAKEQQFETQMKEVRRLRFENELRANPPLPPWKKYPGYLPQELFWRMGIGETYLMEYVWLYLRHASPEEVTAYKANHPEPTEWKGWYGK